MKKIVGLSFTGCFVVALCFGIAVANTGSNFGTSLSDSQMSDLFGGGFVFCGDMDCDTISGSCPGGDTCDPGGSDDGGYCSTCKTGNGHTCGLPAGAGWQCIPTTESCNNAKGVCNWASCTTAIGSFTPPSCGTRPDC